MSWHDPTANNLGEPRPPDVAHVLDVELPFDGDGLYGLRATLAAHASHLGVASEKIEHLVIIGSELASNAVQHGGGSGLLRFWHDTTSLYCQVVDRGPGLTDTNVGMQLPPPDTIGGRGLWICRNLTRELIIEPGPDGHGTSVTAAIAVVYDYPVQ